MKDWMKLAGFIVIAAVVALVTARSTAFLMRLNGLAVADTEAGHIRQRYPLRLIQPEWVVQDNLTINWVVAEMKARLIGILIAWAVTVVALVWKFKRAASTDKVAFVCAVFLVSALAIAGARAFVFSPAAAGGVDRFDPNRIRTMAPFRLIQPEWVASRGNQTVNWIDAEMKARASLVFIMWASSIGLLSWKFMKEGS